MTVSDPPPPQPKLQAGLYLVALPIGHWRDVTLRALDTLKSVNLIACEDKRVMGAFLKRHEITTPLMPYHDHNGARARPILLERLRYESIALVSDAGTPLISDPGYKLVQACYEVDIPVTMAPGPCAPIAALCLSGLPADRFFFFGFLPPKEEGRRKACSSLKDLPWTLIFFEAPHRLVPCLKTMQDQWGDRPAAVVREITKTYEEVRRGTLTDLITYYEKEPPLGEIVIVVQGAQAGEGVSEDQIDALLIQALEQHALKEAVRMVCERTGVSRRLVYQRALEIKP